MRSLRLVMSTTATLALVGSMASGGVAQSPSSGPPLWFGGRVEMPEHSFAVTLPDDWVGFDASVDAASQFEAASDFFDPFWSVDQAGSVDRLASLGSEGLQLLLVHATSFTRCMMGANGVSDMSLDEAAEGLFELYDDHPGVRDVEPPQRVDLPAGPAYVMQMSGPYLADIDAWPSTSIYLLGTGETLAAVFCFADDARPEDDWLSIVETIEFLPAE